MMDPWFIIIGVFVVMTLFQLVTLPVEYDASSRAKRSCSDSASSAKTSAPA